MFGRIILLAATLAATSAYSADLSRQIAATGDPRLDGILSRVTWTRNDFTYSFPNGPNEIKPQQQQIIRETFAELSSFCGLHFREIDDNAVLTFQRWDKGSLLGRVDAEEPGKTFISPLDNQWDGLNIGSYARRWFRHEIGHIVGLEHTHDGFGHGPEPIELDNVSHSVMSYRLTKNWFIGFPRKNVYPQSYMPLDIMALQYLYGPNWQTNNTDTVYKFDPESGPIFKTLWDGGGNDTLDFSAYTTDGIFDMRPGHFSTPSEAQRVEFGHGEKAEGSIAMPYLPKGDPRALIENIIVGNGNNTIILNEADNHVTLGTGRNRVIVYPGTGNDEIEGFGPSDTLDLSNFHIPENFVTVKEDGDDTAVSVKLFEDTIRIQGSKVVPGQIAGLMPSA